MRRFKDEGLITDAADIFTLTKEDIAPLERFGEKSAENIIKEIKLKNKISLSKFLLPSAYYMWEKKQLETSLQISAH